MKINIKQFLPTIAFLGMYQLANGQEKTNSNNSDSEIVMTQEELDMFLQKIADKKRQQMERRRNELMINQQLNKYSKSTSTYQSEELSNASYDRILREFDRINNRIDLMMMNGSLNQQPQTFSNARAYDQGRPNTIIYSQPNDQPYYVQQPVQPQLNPQYQSKGFERLAESQPQDQELIQMKQQMNQLNEELRVLRLLAQSDSTNDHYKKDIEELNHRLNQLNHTTSVKNETTVIEVDRSNTLSNELRNYSHKIYFGNNSQTISQQDRIKLEEVADIVKANSPKVVVVVRGFASQRGNAQYNNSLSFKRAEAVKNILISKGLNAKDIVTLYHGVDNGTSEQEARRVEISFLAN